MNKSDITRAIALDCNISIELAGKALDSMLSTISKALDNNEEVSLPDFGKFKLKRFKQRKGINPITREPIIIPEKEKTVFSPYQNIRLYHYKYQGNQSL